MSSSVANTAKILKESVSDISRLPSGVGEKHLSAFNSFCRGVTQATSGKDASQEELLGPLDPKAPVLRMLVELHHAKKIYRKKVEECFKRTLQVDSWLQALKEDEELCQNLPEELANIFTERLDAEEAGEGADSGGSTARVDDDAFKDAFKEESKEHRVGDEDPAAIREQIDRGRHQIEVLNFRVGDSIDHAAVAFESFYKGVNQAAHSKVTDDDEALGNIPMKEHILAFLVDLIEVKPKYRSRVAATLSRLLNIEGWRQASQVEFSVTMVINQLIADTEQRMSAPPPEVGGYPVQAGPDGMPPQYAPCAAASTNPFAPGGGGGAALAGSGASSPSAGAAAGGRIRSVSSTNPFGGGAAPVAGAVPLAGCGGAAGASCAAPLAPTNPFSAGAAPSAARAPNRLPLAQPGGRGAAIGAPAAAAAGAHPTNPFGAAGGAAAPVPRVSSMEAVGSPSMMGPGAKVPRASSSEAYPLGGNHTQSSMAGLAVRTAAQHPRETAAVAGLQNLAKVHAWSMLQ
eukprot:CAMPEP_0178384902 /NCGR_PEP_ID=MMETSP0689_2-20121128/7757_1 /TAXON_ID=160604 /ORGANISM="Amphidinium massartii, Strain CS-259" /LENGTH=515 /DNA_ID=CAMNT_0020005169 /DNA_START=45 /DNA_END=1592 /DNA_ORIENTATION=+